MWEHNSFRKFLTLTKVSENIHKKFPHMKIPGSFATLQRPETVFNIYVKLLNTHKIWINPSKNVRNWTWRMIELIKKRSFQWNLHTRDHNRLVNTGTLHLSEFWVLTLSEYFLSSSDFVRIFFIEFWLSSEWFLSSSDFVRIVFIEFWLCQNSFYQDHLGESYF